MLHIPDVLTAETLAQVKSLIARGTWVDGAHTAGHLSAKVKANEQIDGDDPAGLKAAAIILDALAINPLFAASALAAKISPPLFNRYQVGAAYGNHVDGAILPLGSQKMRTDLSATLFLSDPQDYDGGELEIADSSGSVSIKLAAGDMILYASGDIHEVRPVTSGTRIASVFWVQSLVRSASERAMLFDVHKAIQSVPQSDDWHDHRLSLTALYHDLLRKWADVG